MQSLMWRRSADQVTALPEEGHLPEGRGGGPLPVPHHLSGADPALPHPGLPARVEHWILVSGGFTVAVEKCEGHGFRCPAQLCVTLWLNADCGVLRNLNQEYASA